jgi:NAD(P)-dependent dehydrogenase (short-subunit alcohol dehydrogenase family)
MNRQHRYMDPPTKGEENDPSDNHLEGRSTCRLQGGTLGPVASVVASEGGVTTRGGSAEQRRRSEYDRPETIEETAELIDQVGGHGIAVSVDHLEPEEVRSLVGRIEEEQGRLDVLVNDVWGGEHLIEWNVPVWEHSLEGRLRMLRLAIDTHIITSRLRVGHF